MIHLQTILRCVDNSEAKDVQCINMSKKKFASINDSILVSIKSTTYPTSSEKIQKKQVHNSLIVHTKKPLKRADGSYFRSDQNSVILLKSNNEKIGNRMNSYAFFESNLGTVAEKNI